MELKDFWVIHKKLAVERKDAKNQLVLKRVKPNVFKVILFVIISHGIALSAFWLFKWFWVLPILILVDNYLIQINTKKSTQDSSSVYLKKVLFEKGQITLEYLQIFGFPLFKPRIYSIGNQNLEVFIRFNENQNRIKVGLHHKILFQGEIEDTASVTKFIDSCSEILQLNVVNSYELENQTNILSFSTLPQLPKHQPTCFNFREDQCSISANDFGGAYHFTLDFCKKILSYQRPIGSGTLNLNDTVTFSLTVKRGKVDAYFWSNHESYNFWTFTIENEEQDADYLSFLLQKDIDFLQKHLKAVEEKIKQ